MRNENTHIIYCANMFEQIPLFIKKTSNIYSHKYPKKSHGHHEIHNQ
jgi:hypothetical protein